MSVLAIKSSLDLIFEDAGYFTAHLVPCCADRPFARSGQLVRNKLCLDANNAVGLPKQRTSYQSSSTLLCFASPTALFASQHYVTGPYKGPIGIYISVTQHLFRHGVGGGGVGGSFFAFLFCYFLRRLFKAIAALSNPRIIFRTKSNWSRDVTSLGKGHSIGSDSQTHHPIMVSWCRVIYALLSLLFYVDYHL